MKIFLTLLKMHLKLNFGISALKYRFTKEKKKRWEPILILFAIISGIGPLLALYVLMTEGIYKAGLSMGQPEIVIIISFLAGQFFVLIFGLFYVMGAFYFSNDMSILIPLPLKPYQVLGSKFIVIMVNEYLTLLPILVPPILIYGLGTGAGFIYWIKAAILIAASPVIPLVIDSLFIVVLMRFVNIRRSKDILAVAGGFIGMFLAVGLNYFFQRLPKENSGEYIKNMLEGRYELIRMIGSRFPPSLWAALGLTKTGVKGIGYFLLFIAFSAVLFAVLLWIGNHIFYKSLLSGQEVSRKRKSLTERTINHRYERTSGHVTAIFRREWKLMLRTPVYMLNGLTGTFMGPLIVAMMFGIQGKSGELDGLLEYMHNPKYEVIFSLGGLGFMMFTAGMNIAASTAVSREGRMFWISKIIPVPAGKQVLGKLLQCLTISIIGTLITGIILAVFFKIPVTGVLTIFIISVFASVLLTALNMIIDVLRPKLVWNNPQEAMKQNMNGLLGMIVSFTVIGMLAALSILLIRLKLTGTNIYAILATVIIILTIPSLLGLFASAERQYKKLEM